MKSKAELKRTTVQRGDSAGFVFRLDEPGNWSCTLHLKSRRDGNSLITPRAVANDGNNNFPGYLTSAETQSLDPGMYFVIGVLTNGDRSRELFARLVVREAF